MTYYIIVSVILTNANEICAFSISVVQKLLYLQLTKRRKSFIPINNTNRGKVVEFRIRVGAYAPVGSNETVSHFRKNVAWRHAKIS